jgi:hypothetical protein
MLIPEPLPFIKDYIHELNVAIKTHCPEKKLSRIQQYWLAFCIMAVIVTNSVCWARFQRASIGTLLERFKNAYPQIRIRCIFADALYGNGEFLDQASRLFGGIQVISQIRANQLIRFRNKKIPVEKYFRSFPGTPQTVRVRGGKQIHSLFFHPAQLAQIENKLPAYTVGSLTGKVKVEGILAIFEQIISSEAPMDRFKEFAASLEDNVIALNSSSKHMVGRELGKFESSSSLKHRNAA